MPREKEPGMAIEEAKSRLRLEEVEAEAGQCMDCREVRETGDESAYCERHLRKVYGVYGQ